VLEEKLQGGKAMQLQLTVSGAQSRRQSRHSDDRLEKGQTSAATKSPSILGWYYILRAHHQWTVFQAIRYALWLSR
jgi:hypothetical protein